MHMKDLFPTLNYLKYFFSRHMTMSFVTVIIILSISQNLMYSKYFYSRPTLSKLPKFTSRYTYDKRFSNSKFSKIYFFRISDLFCNS